VILHPLFHWSPAARRAAIERRGLRIDSPPTVDSRHWGRVCVCMSPSHAWALSAGYVGEPGQVWDLWMVQLSKQDDVEVMPFTGNIIEEIRISNNIPRDRLWYVGARTVPDGLELTGH